MTRNHSYILVGVVILTAFSSAYSGSGPGENSASRPDFDLLYQGIYREIALGELKEAMAIYRSIGDDPAAAPEAVARALVRLGICLEKQGEILRATECYKRARHNFARYPSIREKASEGLVRLYAGSTDPSRQEKEEAPPLPGLISGGLKEMDRDNLPEAKKLFEEAYNRDPENYYLQFLLATVCRKLEYYPEAIFYYNRVVKSAGYRANYAVYQELARCYREMGELENAIRLWEDYPKKYVPNFREMIEFEIHLIREAENWSGGETIPGRLREMLDLGERQTRAGEYKPAAATYLRARELFPENSYPPYRLAFLSEHFQDKPKVAIWYYKEAIKKSSGRFAQRLRELIRERKEAENKKR